MAEAIGGAKARHGVHDQPPPARLPQRLKRLVSLQLAPSGRDHRGRSQLRLTTPGTGRTASVPIAEMSTDPKQPSRFEKKNITGRGGA